jgi:hypothetical protein
VGLERGSLNLVSTIEELLGRNSNGSDLGNWEYCRGDPLRWPRDTLYPQKLALTSPTSGDGSVGIVSLRTKATEFVCFFLCFCTDIRPGSFTIWYATNYRLFQKNVHSRSITKYLYYETFDIKLQTGSMILRISEP